MAKVFWALGISLLLFISASGVFDAWKQHAKITAARPVQVTVVSAKVEKHLSVGPKGRKSTSFEPVIQYRFELGGRRHSGRGVYPGKERGSLAWAKQLVSRFEPGSVHQGYYLPGKVLEAFLIRRYSFEPYLRILLPAAVLGVALFIGQFFRRRPVEPPAPRADGWHEVATAKTIGTKVAFPLAIAGFWHSVGLLALGHYFLVSRPNPSGEAIAFAWVYEAAGLIPLASAACIQFVRRSVSNAQVSVSTAKPRLGGEIGVRVVREAQRDLEFREVQVGLVCRETRKVRRGLRTNLSTSVCWQHWETALRDHPVYRGEALKVEVRLEVPAGGEPSTPPGEKGYPRYRWSITLVTKIAGTPDDRTEVPIIVVGVRQLSRVLTD